MKAYTAIVLLSLAAGGCGPRESNISFNLRAISASEVRLPDEEFFAGDPTALPLMLDACGVREFRTHRGEAGELSFGFEVPKIGERRIVSCIERRVPKGVYLRPVYTL